MWLLDFQISAIWIDFARFYWIVFCCMCSLYTVIRWIPLLHIFFQPKAYYFVFLTVTLIFKVLLLYYLLFYYTSLFIIMLTVVFFFHIQCLLCSVHIFAWDHNSILFCSRMLIILGFTFKSFIHLAVAMVYYPSHYFPLCELFSFSCISKYIYFNSQFCSIDVFFLYINNTLSYTYCNFKISFEFHWINSSILYYF